MKNNLKIIVSFLLIMTMDQRSFAQIHDNKYDPGIRSPNTASLMEFGMVPVSLFNGTANIDVPFYELDYHGIKVPISISYNTSGNRVENHPSLVGLGWALQAGGVITGFGGSRASPSISGGVREQLYYDQWKADLGASDWTTKNFDAYHIYALQPFEFSFNFLGMSGSFYMDHTGTWRIKSKENLMFKIEHVIQDNTQIAVPYSSIIPKMFERFILTGLDGTKYVFGGATNAIEYTRQAILADFSYDEGLSATAWHLTAIITPKATITFSYDREVVLEQTVYSSISNDGSQTSSYEAQVSNANEVNAVHPYLIHQSLLSEIKAGDDIKITFSRSNANELKYKARPVAYRDVTEYIPSEPVQFSQLNTYLYGTSISTITNYASNPSIVAVNRSSKLDNVKILDSRQGVIKNIALNYIENSNERLKLAGISMGSLSETAQRYTFQYNPLMLPDYNTGFEDHWGFYNGKNYPWTGTGGSSQEPFPDDQAYYASREPDANYMQAEVLNKIIYPTGGTSEFVYEPHDYSQVVKYSPIVLEPVANNPIAGGLRIRKIINTDPVSSQSTTREFFYKKNYINGGNTSSGISSGKPVYTVSGPNNLNNFVFIEFSSESFTRFSNTNGSHVTYTEVAEKTPEGGYTVYTYNNHDNGYLDHAPFRVSGNPSQVVHAKLFGELALERGLMKEKTIYDKDKTPLQQELLTYNDDPSRYDDYVRSYNYTNILGDATYGYLVYTLPIYTFTPYLKRKTTNQFFQNGNHLSNVVEFEYANSTHRQLIKQTTTNSDGATFLTEYKYPHDYTAQEPYTTMVNTSHIWNPVIEQSRYKGVVDNAHFLESTRVNYSSWNGDSQKIYPASVLSQKSTGNAWTNLVYDGYDDRGNVLGISQNGSSKTSYQWGYNKQYPVAQVINSSSNDFFYDSFEEGNSAPIADAKTGHYSYNSNSGFYSKGLNGLDNGAYILSYWLKSGTSWTLQTNNVSVTSNSYTINIPGQIDDVRFYPVGAQMTTYTYDPLVGMTSTTDAAWKITFYEYDSLQRLKTVRDKDGNVVKSYCYNYAGQQTGCDVPAVQPSYGTIYARVEISNQSTVMFHGNPKTIGDVYIKLYSDAACTTPYTLTGNLSVNVAQGTTIVIDYGSPDSSSSNVPYSMSQGSSSYYIGNKTLEMITVFSTDTFDNITYDSTYSYDVATGTGYIVSPSLIN